MLLLLRATHGIGCQVLDEEEESWSGPFPSDGTPPPADVRDAVRVSAQRKNWVHETVPQSQDDESGTKTEEEDPDDELSRNPRPRETAERIASDAHEDDSHPDTGAGDRNSRAKEMPGLSSQIDVKQDPLRGRGVCRTLFAGHVCQQRLPRYETPPGQIP